MKGNDFRGLKLALEMVIIALVAVSFFLVLYYRDNRYTTGSPQASEGVLTITEEGIRHHPVHSLVKGWEFYPDQLLEPEDFQEKGTAGEPYYVVVGRYGTMKQDEEAGWVKGTFRMTICFPENHETYGIQIAEIPSASRIYIGGQPVLLMGLPEEEKTGIGSRVIPVKETGDTELLIQVSDLSVLHSHMFTPPLLGTYKDIVRVHDISRLIRLVFLGVASLGAALFLYMAVAIRWWRGYLFFLFCVCFVGVGVCPLLRTGFVLGIQPAYSITVFSFYAVLWVTVVLENDLYRIRTEKLSVIIGAFLVMAVAYSSLVAYAAPFLAKAFYYMTEWYKYGIAFYLILVSEIALIKEMERSRTLLIMSMAFTSALFMEQLLPFYEPILGVPFIMIGYAALLIGMFCILWRDMVDAFRNRVIFLEENERILRQLSMQKEHYRNINKSMEETRRLRHDMRHYLRLLSTMAEEGNVGEIRRFLGQVAPVVKDVMPLTYTGNYALNAVLSHYLSKARSMEVETDVNIMLPETLGISEEDICVIFGNLLENGIEACERQEKGGRRFLFVRSSQEGGRLLIVMDNSYEGNVRYSQGFFCSSKREGVGIGVESVKSIVKKYGGTALFEPEENIFRVSIVIPVEEEKKI